MWRGNIVIYSHNFSFILKDSLNFDTRLCSIPDHLDGPPLGLLTPSAMGSKRRRLSALPTPVNRRISGIPAFTPKSVSRLSKPSQVTERSLSSSQAATHSRWYFFFFALKLPFYELLRRLIDWLIDLPYSIAWCNFYLYKSKTNFTCTALKTWMKVRKKSKLQCPMRRPALQLTSSPAPWSLIWRMSQRNLLPVSQQLWRILLSHLHVIQSLLKLTSNPQHFQAQWTPKNTYRTLRKRKLKRWNKLYFKWFLICMCCKKTENVTIVGFACGRTCTSTSAIRKAANWSLQYPRAEQDFLWKALGRTGERKDIIEINTTV